MPTPKQQLFQVNVETKKGIIAVSPKMLKGACDELANAIRDQIWLGQEKAWRNPQVLPVINLEN